MSQLYMLLMLATLATGFLLRKNNLVVTRTFVAYMVLTLVVECAAIYMAFADINNIWLYNLYMLPCFIFWITAIAKNSRLGKYQPLPLVSFLLLAVANLLAGQQINHLNSYTFVAGTFIYVVLFFFYIRQFFTATEANTNISLLLFYGAGLGYFSGLAIDMILFPAGLLSNEIFAGITLDSLLVNAVNLFFYAMLCFAIINGYRQVLKKQPVAV